MNERIKELVSQSKFMAEETVNKQISKNAELDAFAEKFAELVIAECLDILEDEDTHDIYGQPIRLAAIRIKKLFGVEE